MKKKMPTLAAVSCVVLAFSLPSIALSESSGQHLFICTNGEFLDRSTGRKERAPLSVSITFDFSDNSSELLIGSRSNSIIGQREPLYLDGLVREDEATITGFMQEETDTSEYWTLQVDEKTAFVSLDDIVVLAEDCIDFGSSSPIQPVRTDSNFEEWWASNATAEDWWLLRNYIYQLFESRVDEEELRCVIDRVQQIVIKSAEDGSLSRSQLVAHATFSIKGIESSSLNQCTWKPRD